MTESFQADLDPKNFNYFLFEQESSAWIKPEVSLCLKISKTRNEKSLKYINLITPLTPFVHHMNRL